MERTILIEYVCERIHKPSKMKEGEKSELSQGRRHNPNTQL